MVVVAAQHYADDGLPPLTEYCYRVRATNAAGLSTYTNVDCATTGAAPTVATFQQGVGGYSATFDTYIMEANATTDHGTRDSVV